MCSIAIPSELMLGHSPPVYGSLLYSSLMVTTPPIANRTVPTQIRSCLASASLHLDGLLKSNGESSANIKRSKKRVVFADDRGRPLTQVRVMSEPSNMPPLWTSAYVASLARGDLFHLQDDYDHLANSSDEEAQNQQQQQQQPMRGLDNGHVWEVCFRQPASDYIAFRNKLDKNSVSLENVIVRESEHCIIGTIKVKNIAYAKQVTLRATFDNWATHQDVECTYVEQPGLVSQTAVRSLYDTFRFRFDLPPKDHTNTRQIDFCVRYFTDGVEFWDNNDGVNYSVKKKRDQATLEEQIAELLSACCGPSSVHSAFNDNSTRRSDKDNMGRPLDETTQCQVRTWSEFASWQHLENDAPYW